jgi:lipoate-protein ligase A
MSKYRLFFVAVSMSVLFFIQQWLPAADIQKPVDSKTDGKRADKTRIDKSSESGSGKGGGSAFGDRGGLFSKFISELSQEDLERLKKLSKENPEGFREEIRKKMESNRSEFDGQNSKASELAEKFRKALNDTEKAKVKGELRDSVKDEFEKKMEINLKRLEQAEKQLGEFRLKLDERKQKADEIIDGRVNDLLRDPSMKW